LGVEFTLTTLISFVSRNWPNRVVGSQQLVFLDLSDIRSLLVHGTWCGDAERSINAHGAANSATDLASRLKSLDKELNREFN
jgi:hypothetical protein